MRTLFDVRNMGRYPRAPLRGAHVPDELRTDDVGPLIRTGPQQDLRRVSSYKEASIGRHCDRLDVTILMPGKVVTDQDAIDPIPQLDLSAFAAAQHQASIARIHRCQSLTVTKSPSECVDWSFLLPLKHASILGGREPRSE